MLVVESTVIIADWNNSFEDPIDVEYLRINFNVFVDAFINSLSMLFATSTIIKPFAIVQA